MDKGVDAEFKEGLVKFEASAATGDPASLSKVMGEIRRNFVLGHRIIKGNTFSFAFNKILNNNAMHIASS